MTRPLVVKALIVFGVALLLRFAVSYYHAATDAGEYLFQDSSSYYRLAVNLATGRGYVLKEGQEPYFFREPGTSYFFAGTAALYGAVTGRRLAEPVYDANNWPRDHDNQNVIRLIRLSQAVLQALALVLFFLLLRHAFDEGFAFLVALAASLYPPLALYSEQLMRENLLLGVLMALAYVLSSHFRKPAYWKLAAIGVLWGLSALTLQVYVVLGVFLCAFVSVGTRSILLAARRCAVVVALFLLTALPWLHTVYAFEPDLRIARSMGCALTSDWSRLSASLQYARDHSPGRSGTAVVPADPMLATDMYAFTTRECFDLAFNGSFVRAASALDARYGTPSVGEKAREYAGMLAWFLVLPGYQYDDWSASRDVPRHDHGGMALTMFLSFMLSASSVFGLWACCRRARGVLPVYLFHLAFFWILMSASRRALPVVPFFVLFGMVGLVGIVQRAFPRFRFPVFREGAPAGS